MLAFLAISTLFLLILWLVLTVFLDDIYKAVKAYESTTLLRTISEDVEANSLDLEDIDERYDTRVYMIDGKGSIRAVSGNAVLPMAMKDWMKKLLVHIYDTADQAGKPLRIYLKENDFERLARGEDVSSVFGENKTNPDRILDLEIVEYRDEEVMILLTTRLYPVRLTTLSIRWVLIFGSLAFMLFSLISSAILARSVALPMEKINREAAKIAAGNYSVQFPENGPREIAELSDTLNYTSRELQATEDLQHEIIANVSHDLRTPLTMIRGYAELMRDLPGENSPENLQIIIDETDRLSDLINDVLYVSRIQSAVETPKMAVYSLTRSIRSILYRISMLQKAEGYHFVYRDSGHEIFVSADVREIDRVLYNLLGNAINYIGDDRTVIVDEEIFEKDGKTFVRISVTDHGEGIAEEELPRIWDRYYKAEREKRDRQIGTGLGLAIAKEILEMHHSEYGVRSTLGEGSTFWFTLPAARPERKDIAE